MKAAVILGTVLKLKEDDPVHGSLPPHGLQTRQSTDPKIEASTSSSGESRARSACGSPAPPMQSSSPTSSSGEKLREPTASDQAGEQQQTQCFQTVKGKHQMARLRGRREAGEGSDKWSCATSTECGRRLTIRHQLQNDYQDSAGAVYPLGGGFSFIYL